MNPAGVPGLGPGLVVRGQPQKMAPAGVGRVSLAGGSNPGGNPAVRRPGSTGGGKLMRLRCRFRPLHDAYIKNGEIIEDDTDVIFICGDGHQIRAHRVIMASSSKFFAKLFEDQSGEISVVNIPDVKVDIMNLILQLTYRDRVILTMRQIKTVGEFITMFGMAWAHFGFEEYNGEEPMSALPMAPIPAQPVELPQKMIYQSISPQAQAGLRQIPANNIRTPMQQNLSNNGTEDEDYNYKMQYGNDQSQAQGQRTSGHSRKSRLTPRAGTEMADEIIEQDAEEDPENIMRDWMSKLGKRDTTQNAGTASGSVKRMRMDESLNESVATNSGAAAAIKNVCTVCNTGFQTESAWRWHEDRHVGINMFKCQFCDNLSRSPKLCYIHEKEVHGYSGLQSSSPTKPTTADQKRVLIRTNQPGKFLVMNQRIAPSASEAQKITKRIKMAQYKKLQAQKKKVNSTNFPNRHPQIGIGESEGSELLDVKKIKQLHWLYVCDKCENCSDSASKATIHYNRCYPNQEKGFEETVTKYRQGFYGKSKCPLCPRRYPQNSGFMIHCGHQHQQYRRLFSHTGTTEDTLKCVGCKSKFAEPLAFHDHLENTAHGSFYCGIVPENAVGHVKPGPGRPPGSRNSTEKTRSRRADSPIESKASYKVQFHTPPKSARLASRAQAEAASANAEANAKNKATDINFPPVDCPVCGDSDLPNISAHLQTKHKDLNVDVTRIASELLRCKGCTITFNICDLLDHKDCLLANEADKEEPVSEPPPAQRRASTNSIKQPAKPAVVDVDSLPPGVGRSPIESIEIEDLNSIQAIRSALTCRVCGVTAKKLGAIADCLRAHGVFRCSLCFNSYISKTDYALHLKKCHGSALNRLKCPLCVKSFANAGQTSGHMYSTHWLQMLKENESMGNGGGVVESEDKAPSESKTEGISSEMDDSIEASNSGKENHSEGEETQTKEEEDSGNENEMDMDDHDTPPDEDDDEAEKEMVDATTLEEDSEAGNKATEKEEDEDVV